ncbi:hypothetical protein [Herbaspirillum sp. YR522]|uniref:hypothetical protein n=1 Tax=Herbaspirillum sp. YR522 TaxID=1144342 RepID=UPI00026F8824|nr:hypothetical protein [Herbaspirillum sp. YR522]EJN08023.1 hypothetical protein PMI40_01510 [Herbaspirillum sp. YR522]
MDATPRSDNPTSQREQAQQVLDPLLRAQTALAPISEFHGPGERQQPADPRFVFELRKNGADYSLHATDARASFVPEVDGEFIYVIKASDPGRVYVALDRRLSPPALRRYGVQGHTSIDNGSDVLYAGELSFRARRLQAWDNSSGHYRPAPEARHANLLPVVRNLLPESLFGDVRKPMTLRLGRLDVTVDDLRAMGARINGRPLWSVALAEGIDVLQQNLAQRLQFEAQYLVGGQRADRAVRNAEILMEVAATRGSTHPLVISKAGDNLLVAALNDQLGRLRLAVGRIASGARSNVITYLMPGGGVVRQTGAGLQVFGIYNSVRSLSAAIERGDTSQAVLQSAGLGAQGASLAAEALIPRLGRALQAGGVAHFNAFAASSLGQRLGGTARLGTNVARSGAAVGTVLTLPFDIYRAVTSFQQASVTSGRTAQDHYVDAGFATAGAALSVGLAAAAFAGVSAAGPLGIILGLGLVIGNGIYHSVREVDELDRYARLGAGERFVTGLGSMLGISAAQDIEDRAAVGRAREVYQRAKRRQLQAVLQEKDWRVAIFGDAVITPQPPLQQWRSGLMMDPYYDAIELVQQPAKVIDNAADDSIDASAGLRGVANRVRHRASSGDTILWATGDGNDRLLAPAGRISVFSLHRGTKAVRGGDRDDIFMLNAAPGAGSAFDGGDGADTLVLAASPTAAGTGQVQVRVALDRYDQPWEWDASPADYIEIDDDGVQHSRRKTGTRVSPSGDAGTLWWDGRASALRAIENVITSADATTAVTGNDQDNVFVLNGRGDSAAGLGGNDTYVVNGAGHVRLYAGVGENHFRLGRGIDTVDILSGSVRDRLMLEFDLADIEARVVGRELRISLAGEADEARKTVSLQGLLRDDGSGGTVARRDDADLLLWTRDGFVVAPLLSALERAEDGMIELAAMRASGAQLQAMELLLQAASAMAGAPATGLAAGEPTAPSLAQAVLASPGLS